ncbi:Bromodomain-containing protein [Pilaira anomala]|nr:Bromodomain-containing protein [Pilaira anomala]
MATAEWTVLEKLLLVQAVYKYGEDNWFQIARNLKHHALLDRPSDYFNQKNCSIQYYLMVEEMNKQNISQDMPTVVRIARELYALRLEELKKAINQDEEKFLHLISEIDDIRAGKWDNQLLDGAESIAGSESNAATPTNERKKGLTMMGKDDQRHKSWQKNINLLWREIANHKNGAMFMNPIKETIAPHYYDILINTTTEFERDVVLMLNNSLMYNKEGTEVYQMAREMLDDATEQIQIFKTADNDTAASSHTRAASMAAKERRKSVVVE